VFPPLLLSRGGAKKVLVLGGGDGLAVRELLKYPGASITLIELDPAMMDLARHDSSLTMLNGGSLNDPRVRVIVGDAYTYLLHATEKYDVIIADFPDPHDETISKLYTVEFYRLAHGALNRGGIFVTQSTSPFFAREAFWCINRTMKQGFRFVVPYHVYVPSFGDWGFNMAFDDPFDPGNIPAGLPGLRYYSRESFLQSMHFPADSAVTGTEVNSFNKPVLYTYYLKGWRYYSDM
jgi:spermidine synthase